MKKVGSYEAKTHLPELLDQVQRGELITITKHGKPVARLVPVEDYDQAQVANTISGIKRFRQGNLLGEDLTIRTLIDEGRRL